MVVWRKQKEILNEQIMKKNKIIRYVVAIVLIAFALATLFMSSSVIFDWFGIRAKEGNYVPFIVWANFIAGFLYLISAYGFLKSKRWTFWILIRTTIILIMAFIGLLVHIGYGGIYETKTVGAMGFRIAITIAFTAMAYYKVKEFK